jgi:predicted phosphate transport protein (TIGR00153 family)
MGIGKFLKIFIPQEKSFFPLFEQGSANLIKIAELLKELLSTSDIDKQKEITKGIKELELVGDKITYTVYETLNSTFITPFDREEIHDLASSIDDFADQVNTTAQRVHLYKLTIVSPELLKMADILIEAAKNVDIAVNELKNMSNKEVFDKACIQISVCENRADEVFHKAISDLFEYETDCKELIKKKQVLESLEKAADKADDIENVLKTIQLKVS